MRPVHFLCAQCMPKAGAQLSFPASVLGKAHPFSPNPGRSSHYKYQPSSFRISRSELWQLSYPHFGPKNTLSNSYYFLILSNSLCFLLCFNCIHYRFSLLNFCIKSYKRVFWSFPTKEPIFSPYNLSLSLFNLFA